MMVGSKKVPWAKSPAVSACRLPAALRLPPSRSRRIRRRLDLRFIDLRAHFDGRVEAIADLESLGAHDKLLGEFRGNALLQQDAAGRSAALARGAKGAPQRAIEGEVEIGVVEDDLAFLPPISSETGLKVAAARWPTNDPTSLDPVKLMARTSRCSISGVPTCEPEAADNIDDARRQPRVDEGLHQVMDGERRVRGRLDDAGVSSDQGRETASSWGWPSESSTA